MVVRSIHRLHSHALVVKLVVDLEEGRWKAFLFRVHFSPHCPTEQLNVIPLFGVGSDDYPQDLRMSIHGLRQCPSQCGPTDLLEPPPPLTLARWDMP